MILDRKKANEKANIPRPANHTIEYRKNDEMEANMFILMSNPSRDVAIKIQSYR